MKVMRQTVERCFQGPRSLIWALFADTDRIDRAMGLSAATYHLEDESAQGTQFGTAREVGVRIAWEEPPYAWVEGERVHGQRRFKSGPVQQAGLDIWLEDAGDAGTRVRISPFCVPRHTTGWLLASIAFRPVPRGCEGYCDAVEAALPAWEARWPALLKEHGGHPLAAARELLDSSPDPRLSLAPKASLSRGVARLSAALCAAGHAEARVDALMELLQGGSEAELRRLRSKALARRWAAPHGEVLDLLLDATLEGLLSLRWMLICPSCRVSSGERTSLSAMAATHQCPTCYANFALDAASHVEAVFQVHAAVRPTAERRYCASSPTFQPHKVAQLPLPAGFGQRVPVPEGPLTLRVLEREDALLGVPAGTQNGRFVLANGALQAELRPMADGGRALRLVTEAALTLCIERQAEDPERLSAVELASHQRFLDFFAAEAPATGVELQVSRVALLFTDLTGSTAMYRELGDARAFARVQHHFEVVTAIVRRHAGAVVKTMGDAVMASFPCLEEATAAALEMRAVHDSADPHLEGLGIKVGVHEGPALVVRANDRLDYFGTTVNTAARLQGSAACGEVVVSTVFEGRLAARFPGGLEKRHFAAPLKGLGDAVPLCALLGTSQPRHSGVFARQPSNPEEAQLKLSELKMPAEKTL